MYVCVYVCMCVCMCVCVCICVYVCMYVCMYVGLCMYVCMCVCMYVGLCMYVCMYVGLCMYVCMYVNIHRRWRSFPTGCSSVCVYRTCWTLPHSPPPPPSLRSGGGGAVLRAVRCRVLFSVALRPLFWACLTCVWRNDTPIHNPPRSRPLTSRTVALQFASTQSARD